MQYTLTTNTSSVTWYVFGINLNVTHNLNFSAIPSTDRHM